jgi:hypothetical protein
VQIKFSGNIRQFNCPYEFRIKSFAKMRREFAEAVGRDAMTGEMAAYSIGNAMA